MDIILVKYKHEWSLFNKNTHSYILFGTKREMKKQLEKINNLAFPKKILA